MKIIVDKIPADTPPEAHLYLVGNFNRWQPGVPVYRLQPQPDGTYEVTVPFMNRPVEFKVTRGTWETVEAAEDGSDRPNRKIKLPFPPKVMVQVANWTDLVTRPPRKHTASPQVQVLDSAFEMPELGRTRRIWLYLPIDYATSKKRYPVLYLHDGQNLFDAYYSFSGEWGIDETLDEMAQTGGPEVIVVGIEHGGEERLNELTPYKNPAYGGGDGKKYLQFIVQDLKPYIDEHFRTQPEAEHTGIGGSSLGGLISLYAAAHYPHVFGKAMILSPSLWFSDKIFNIAKKDFKNTRLVLLAGEQEGEEMIPRMRKLFEHLIAHGFPEDQIWYQTRPDGNHSEWFWRREFPEAFKWLYAKK
ncbi:alpha-dextran endo-1,6-alpha-glucosidase [Adhaeribacter arboris]|uniref:Alpha-dextran endo-1,6-alpha-glucosidase n=1 Tax=Adhaeribacter arboris TaxID=2072846 RepID=A0A2T2YN28_9BACT|nr:alpha/beta hydrolase-fold protein [Adhaeribacter arboris]PSR56922.1 alpha-dextran endo-1,6-alpha-glucosidase [Adhaeribacter arboris]